MPRRRSTGPSKLHDGVWVPKWCPALPPRICGVEGIRTVLGGGSDVHQQTWPPGSCSRRRQIEPRVWTFNAGEICAFLTRNSRRGQKAPQANWLSCVPGCGYPAIKNLRTAFVFSATRTSVWLAVDRTEHCAPSATTAVEAAARVVLVTAQENICALRAATKQLCPLEEKHIFKMRVISGWRCVFKLADLHPPSRADLDGPLDNRVRLASAGTQRRCPKCRSGRGGATL